MRLVFFETFHLLQIALFKLSLSLKLCINSAIFLTELLNRSDDLWKTTSTNYIRSFRISNKNQAKYVLKRQRTRITRNIYINRNFFLFRNSKLDIRKNNTLQMERKTNAFRSNFLKKELLLHNLRKQIQWQNSLAF